MKKFVALFAVLVLLTLTVLPACAEGDVLLIAPAPQGENVQKDTFTGSEELLDMSLPTTGAQPEESDGFTFEPGNFVANLSYMATGMIGIFIVIGLIVLGTVILNKTFKEKQEKSE